MGGLFVPENIKINSFKGGYEVFFVNEIDSIISSFKDREPHFILDAKVAKLYSNELNFVLEHPNTILVEAIEENKSIESIIPLFKRLVDDKVRRTHVLVGIGGGIIQDITCFVASTLLRGLQWDFIPTTLLAQTDSCIGSKSSINLGNTKNILGTFNPPNHIYIWDDFLNTLESTEIYSGLGEIIKVHAIAGSKYFDDLSLNYSKVLQDRQTLLRYVNDALLIKLPYIEKDEFDLGIRNIFNYGHSFGHAIEAVTRFQVPHGIAVTMGMEVANRIATLRGLLPEAHYLRMRNMLLQNYQQYRGVKIDIGEFISALMKDKKNTTTLLSLVLSVGDDADIKIVQIQPDQAFIEQCSIALQGL